jgi:hypothetical protein
MLVALAVLAMCLIALSESASYYATEPRAFTYSRGAAALLCGSFAVAHLYLLALKHLTFTAALLFYPLCFLLGLTTEIVVRSDAKGWAPSTASEAMFANLIGYSVLSVLVAICVASCYRSFTRCRRVEA